MLCTETGSYTCEFCGKQYKYFNPYQEHVALHTPMSKIYFFTLVHGWNFRDLSGISGICLEFHVALLKLLEYELNCR